MITLTREYLATYVYLESEIKRIRGRIKHYETHPLQQEYGVVKGSMQQFPFSECNFVVSGPKVKSTKERNQKIQQLMVDLKGNEQLLADMKLEIELYLESLPPEQIEMKHILALKYVDRLTDEEISNRLFISRRTLNRKIDSFLSSVNK